MFKVIFNKSSVKQYVRLLNTAQSKIVRVKTNLSQNPLIGKKLGGEFVGLRSLRAWPYRIIYVVNIQKKEVTVVSIEHRQGAYN